MKIGEVFKFSQSRYAPNHYILDSKGNVLGVIVDTTVSDDQRVLRVNFYIRGRVQKRYFGMDQLDFITNAYENRKID